MSTPLDEKTHYLPILLALRGFGGRAEIDDIRKVVASFIHADTDYLNRPSGPKTQETAFEKDFNWAGKRLGDAGLVVKQRSHWALTEEGLGNHFTAGTLQLFVKLAGKRKE